MFLSASHQHRGGAQQSRMRLAFLTVITTLCLTLIGCAPEPGTTPAENTSDPAVSGTPAPSDTDSANGSEVTPDTDKENASPSPTATQEKSCDWNSARLNISPVDPTSEQVGPADAAIIGAWQHVAFIKDGVYEAVDHDIRYVFPSTGEFLYCQDVPGITDQAENEAALTVDGTSLKLEGPSPGYELLAWNSEQLVLLNNFDGSEYLLVRR